MNSPEPPSGKSMVTSAQSTRLVDASITTAPGVGATVTDIGAPGATLAEEETSSARTRLELLPARSDKHNALINVLFICETSNTKQQRRAHREPAHLRFRNTQAECHAVVDRNVGLTHVTPEPRKNIFGTHRRLLFPVVTQNGHSRDAFVRKCPKATVFCIADAIQLWPKELYERGLAMVTVPTPVAAPHNLSPAIKSLNYLAHILAKVEAVNAVEVRPRVGGFVQRVGFVEGATVHQGLSSSATGVRKPTGVAQRAVSRGESHFPGSRGATA